MSRVAAPGRPHVPVMLHRVVELLVDAPAGPVVDCTVGAGGHASALLAARAERHGSAHLIGIDRDGDALALAAETLAETPGDHDLVQARFDAFDAVLDELGTDRVAGVLYDLGISSMHVDRPDRGFSFREEGPLDMRMDPRSPTTAAQLVNHAAEAELSRLIARYGEERHARRIARAIVAARPLTTTTELAEVVRAAMPARERHGARHPATRTFQALRIAVNDELDAFAASLPRALRRLVPGGVCVVLAYHSLEDRIAKRTLNDAATDCVCPPGLPRCGCGKEALVERLTRRPERPTDDEVEANPRARSARLRAVRRLATTDDEMERS